MPFLDPEELKPKLREVFETVVIPQIKKAKMKQTAVEWLVEQMTQRDFIAIPKPEWIEQAKAMEKEQIIDSFGVGCQVESTRLIGYQDIAEQYYQKTYGK